jgi:hypothetical protein
MPFKRAERVRKRTQALRAGCANSGHTPTAQERVKSTDIVEKSLAAMARC